MIKEIICFIIKHSVYSLSRATKLKKDQLSSSIIKQNSFFLLKADKLGLLEGLFGHSSVFSGISFKIFNKKNSSVLL